MSPNTVSQSARETELRKGTVEIADALCAAVDGRFDFAVRVDTCDDLVQKLQMLVNFLLDSARRAVAEVEDKNKQLEHEVAERERAEASLLESEARTRAILDATAQAIVTINERGMITTFNPAASAMFGYSREEIIGRNISILIPGPFAREHDGYLRRYLETGQTHVLNQEREVEGVRRDGTVFPMRLRATEMSFRGERSFVGCIHDISEQRQAEARRKEMHVQLVAASRRAGMTDVATGVLHSVGNVLNSINVSITLATDKVRDSHTSDLAEVAALLQSNRDDLGAFMTTDQRGVLVPRFLTELADRLLDDRTMVLGELESLGKKIEHIKEIIAVQQSYAKVVAVEEPVPLAELIENALEINSAGLGDFGVRIERLFDEIPLVVVDRQKVLQIMVNLISNARHALAEESRDEKRLTLRVAFANEPQAVCIEVTDNGIGIAEDSLTRIFSFGFTTKKNGHGFGLHSSALAAKEMGGTLTVRSPGPGEGATFTLTLPLNASEATP